LFLAAKEKKEECALAGLKIETLRQREPTTYQIDSIPFSGAAGGHKIGAVALQGLCAPGAVRPELRQSRAWRGPCN